MKKNLKLNGGFSLIELLVTIGIFAIVAVLASQAVGVSLQGSRKSDTGIKTRENVDYALGVIERQLRNAEKITLRISCVPPDTTMTTVVLTYKDAAGNDAYFSYEEPGPNGYIASSSADPALPARLTGTDVGISSASFIYTCGTANSPAQVQINLTSGTTDFTTKIDLRTY